MVSVAELKKTRHTLIREHGEALAALDTLIAVFEKREGVPAPTGLIIPRPNPAKSVELTLFEQHILAVMAELPAADITSPSIYEQLIAKNIDTAGADRNAKVNTITNFLYKLVDKGKVEVITPGRGKRATLYGLKGESQEAPKGAS